jgi:hypothetical protein
MIINIKIDILSWLDRSKISILISSK